MKRRATPARRHARRYLVENFPGVPEVLRRYAPEMGQPRLVGPLIATSSSPGDSRGRKRTSRPTCEKTE